MVQTFWVIVDRINSFLRIYEAKGCKPWRVWLFRSQVYQNLDAVQETSSAVYDLTVLWVDSSKNNKDFGKENEVVRGCCSHPNSSVRLIKASSSNIIEPQKYRKEQGKHL